MAFITGMMLIDAPAAALNNSNKGIFGIKAANTTGIKFIHTSRGDYPYVSAQAFRAWLRDTLEQSDKQHWQSPVTRLGKGTGSQAYTAGDPLQYWDDDLFGYMVAEKNETQGSKRSKPAVTEQPTTATTEEKEKRLITRLAPFRVSTLVSIAPVYITEDFGSMARQDDAPVLFTHQFYRATLQGLWSLNLKQVGTFSARDKTGYKNLDDALKKKAEKQGLNLLPDGSYRLSVEERMQRVRSLLDGMAHIEGGAKLTLHYTDVSPALVVMAITKGGNHLFGYIISHEQGLPSINSTALAEALSVAGDEVLSDVYIGWVRGYRDLAREQFEVELGEKGKLADYKDKIKVSHPREAFASLSAALAEHPDWLE